MRDVLPLKSEASPRGRASYKKSQSVSRTAFFCGEARSAANAEVLPAQKQKLRPGSGLLQEEPKPQPHRFFVGAAPRGECDVLPAQSKSFAPRSGLLQKSQKRHPHRFFCGRRDPRRMRCAATQKQKLRPEVGPPTGEPTRQPHRFFLWGGTPRGECGMCCHSKAKLRPEVGPPTRRAKAPPAPLFCGSRDPRRMPGSASSKAKASPRGRASYRRAKSAIHTAFLWEARPAANQASEPLSRAAPRSVRRARRSRRRRAETGCARLAPRQPSEPRPRLPPAAFQGAIQ